MNIMDMAKQNKFTISINLIKAMVFAACHFDQFYVFLGLEKYCGQLNSGIKFQFQWDQFVLWRKPFAWNCAYKTSLIITFYVSVFCFPDNHVISTSHLEMVDFHVFIPKKEIAKYRKYTSSAFSNLF